MWAMLIENLKKNKDGWQLEFKNINCNETEGSCRWEAHYVFSATGRQVHNIIEANFQFKDGLIIRHADSFDFYRWARMAFGIKGTIIGWAPFFRRMVQSRVNGLLKRFMEKNQPGSFSRD